MPAVLLSSKVVRLALNVASYGPATDMLTNAPVKFPKADLRIELAAFYGKIAQAQQLVDISNWVSLTCTFKAMGNGGAAPAGDAPTLAEATVLAAAMNPTMTAEQWAALTHQQVAFDFTEGQINNLSVGQVWCVFTALLNTGKVVPVQFGPMEVVEDGYASGGADPVEAGTAYSKAEADALFAKLAPINGAYRVKTDETGSYWQVKNATTGAWHTVFATGGAGVEQLTLGPSEA